MNSGLQLIILPDYFATLYNQKFFLRSNLHFSCYFCLLYHRLLTASLQTETYNPSQLAIWLS